MNKPIREAGPHLIHVLDHGYVRLVDHMGSDLSIVRSARVSHDADWRSEITAVGVERNTPLGQGKDERLIRYLWRNKHTTPFESVAFTFEVKAPIFVVRQWHRHRTWSYNEISARYTELPEQVYTPDFRLQSTTNKQGSDFFERKISEESRQEILQNYEAIVKAAFTNYRRALDVGVSREVARCILPVSTYTRMFATVNLLNLFKFMTLRSDSHAQYEIRVYSDAMLKLIKTIVPVATAAYLEERTES